MCCWCVRGLLRRFVSHRWWNSRSVLLMSIAPPSRYFVIYVVHHLFDTHCSLSFHILKPFSSPLPSLLYLVWSWYACRRGEAARWSWWSELRCRKWERQLLLRFHLCLPITYLKTPNLCNLWMRLMLKKYLPSQSMHNAWMKSWLPKLRSCSCYGVRTFVYIYKDT